MQQTNKFHFKLIDTDDEFSPNALNDNTRAVETELVRVEAETAAALETKADQTALDAAKSEFNTNHAALTKTVAAVEKGAYFYKLGETAAEAENQAVTFNLSGIRMADYAALLVITGGTGNAFSVNIAVNGTGLANIVSASGAYTGNDCHGACIAALIPAGHSVVLAGVSGVRQPGSTLGSANGGTAELTWTSVTKLQLSGFFPAGTGFTLYGIKK